MATKREIIKCCMGKGGLEASSYKQVKSPINLLKFKGSPPIAQKLPNTRENFLGKKLTK